MAKASGNVKFPNNDFVKRSFEILGVRVFYIGRTTFSLPRRPSSPQSVTLISYIKFLYSAILCSVTNEGYFTKYLILQKKFRGQHGYHCKKYR
jgi:hypothetical protein